jgi:hypothetical protein
LVYQNEALPGILPGATTEHHASYLRGPHRAEAPRAATNLNNDLQQMDLLALKFRYYYV